MAASTAFFGSLRLLTESITIITEVDTRITNLKKVMNEDTQFDKMLDRANTSAEKFSKSIRDVLDAYGEFARQGFSEEDIAYLGDASLIASNVGEISSSQAAEYLTSSMIQLKIETKDAMSVIDSWNNISNNHATTVEKLAQGHSRAAASAAAWGLDMHELNAIIGTVTAATKQSGIYSMPLMSVMIYRKSVKLLETP